MTEVRRLRRAEAGDAGLIVDILADAFVADPFFRWMFGPDQGRLRAGTRAWLTLVVGVALPRGEGWIAADAGAAVWLPPGTELIGRDEMEAAVALLHELVGDRAGDVLGAIGATSSATPDQPHWACLYIGVRPGSQGGGLGRTLMQPGLAAADRDRVPVHLVSTNPATTGFYEHLGFRVLATISSPGAPTLRPMWRDETVDPGVPDGRAIAPRRPVAD